MEEDTSQAPLRRSGGEGLEGCPETVNGEAHDVVEAAVDRFDAGDAYPLLYAVSACFVEGTIFVDISVYLIVFEAGELHAGDGPETLEVTEREERHAGNNLVRAAAQSAKHLFSFGCVAGFAEHTAVDDDDGVGRDEKVFVGHDAAIGVGFESRQVERHVVRRKVGGIGLVNLNGVDDCERDGEQSEELAATG